MRVRFPFLAKGGENLLFQRRIDGMTHPGIRAKFSNLEGMPQMD
jgi:hypothetical protein